MNDISNLVSQLIHWGCGILLVAGFLAAAIYTGIHLMGAMGADDPIKKKKAIKNVIWVWICVLVLALLPILVLVFQQDIINEVNNLKR